MEKIICKNCGNISKFVINDFIKSKECVSCGAKLNWDNVFPNSNSTDFIKLSNLIHQRIKEMDRERKEIEYELLKKQGYEIDKSEIDSYNNLYDSIAQKYPDNNDENRIYFYDEFEYSIYNKLKDGDMATAISIAVDTSYHSHKNSFRKAYVIIVASTIEFMFNEYLNVLIKLSLSEHGRNEFIQRHKRSGVQALLEEINYFLEKPFSQITDDYSKGFYDRWNTFRNKRNDIIHSNERYITNLELTDFKKLLFEAIDVFSKMIGDLYKNKQQ